MSVDLLGLPDVNFVETDTAKIEADILTMYEGLTNTVLYPGDPVRLFLSTLAARITQSDVNTNNTGRMNLLRYATGAFLDHIGAMLDVGRLDEAPAATTIRFTLQQPLAFAAAIPQGTRLTADGSIFFATDTTLTIPAGEVYGEVSATCLSYGTASNGLAPGQINRLVDPLPFVVGVENTIETSGGADVESDDHFRERIRLAPEGFSTAGSTLSYVFWAMSAHQDIIDVSPTSPIPGVVNVFVLLSGGRIPDANGPEIALVYDAVSAIKRRPLTDNVHVYPVDGYPLDYVVTWFVTTAQAGQIATLTGRVEAAVAAYETWQTERIGRDINPDKLTRLCVGAGAKRIELSRKDAAGTELPFDFYRLDDTQVAEILPRADRIRFGGVEDE